MERLFHAWLEWPVKARWASAIGLIWVADSLIPALHDRHPAAAFGERFIALGIYYGLIVGSIALAFKIGPSVNAKFGRHWPAWVVGVSIFLAATLLQNPIGKFFGVSSMLEAIQSPSCYTDWDGRSNMTYCD